MSEDKMYLVLEKFLFLLLYIGTLWVLMKVSITLISAKSKERLEKQRNTHEKDMYGLKNKPQ